MTLIELLWTLGILAFVLSGIIAVFISGLHSEFDMNQRFEAQQEARLALQSMRTDVRTACSASVTANTVVLGFCSNASTTWSSTPVSWSTWCIRGEGGTPAHYGLYRETTSDAANCATTSTAGLREADWLTPSSAFGALTTTSGVRPELPVSISVDANPVKSGGVYTLSDQIMLRNAPNNS
jgi:Tfp pilus assembly protein PilW